VGGGEKAKKFRYVGSPILGRWEKGPKIRVVGKSPKNLGRW